jgi:TRAP-type C4-dicarboxylate transport system permease large subunit
MDITPAVLILTPILLPVVVAQGVDPLHFGIIMITNLCIGLCTPPVGSCLFIGCGVGKTTLAKVTPSLIPFFIAMLLALALICVFPGLSTWLPALFA